MYAAKFVKSKRNKDVLVDDNNFEYTFKDKTKNIINPTTYWKCRERDVAKCAATAKTIIQDNQVFKIQKAKAMNIRH